MSTERNTPLPPFGPIAAALLLACAWPAAAKAPTPLASAADQSTRIDGVLRIPIGAGPTPPYSLTLANGAQAPVRAVAFSPDGALLAAAGPERIALWDLAGARLQSEVAPLRLDGELHCLGFSRDGKWLAAGGGRPGHSGMVLFFDLASGRELAPFVGPTDVVYSLAESPDGTLLAAGAADGRVYLLGGRERTLVGTLEHGAGVRSVSFSPDGKLLASAGSGGVRLWDAARRQPLKTTPQNAPVEAVAFSPDGKLLAWSVAGAQERLVRWEAPLDSPVEKDKPGEATPPKATASPAPPPPKRLDTDFARPLDLAFAGGHEKDKPARLYVATSDGTIKVYDQSGGRVASLVGHGDWVQSLAVDTGRSRLASGSADGTVRLWDSTDGKPLATFADLGAGRWLVIQGNELLHGAAPGPGHDGKK